MTASRIAPALAFGALGLALSVAATARAQDQSKQARDFDSREALHKYYDQQFTELDRRRMADLAGLAGRTSGAESEAAYQELFHLAVARDQYEAAEDAAATVVDSNKVSPGLRALATFVHVIALEDRGEYNKAIQGLRRFLQSTSADKKVDPTTLYAVGEGFLQRLISVGRYDQARQAADLFVQGVSDKSIKEHFAARLERIERLGKAAPPIRGSDIDGKEVSLADMKNKVVLVTFWATWCPPCVAETPNLNALYKKYQDKGFSILGVNLDAAREGVKGREQAMPLVRRFLVDFRVPWPTVFNGSGGEDFAKAYGVSEIPANFLIGKDGKITAVELSGEQLEKAVAEAVGGKGRGD